MLTIWLAITVIAIIIEILTIDLVSIWFALLHDLVVKHSC